MQCLENFIGVRWCNNAEPDSGVYINDLHGISLKQIDNLANDEQLTFMGVWNSVQKRAIQRIKTGVVNYFSKRYRLKNTSQSVELPETAAE
jgi:hypothetical protein